jgi:hypothetical protein
MVPSRSSYKQFFPTGSVTGLVLGTALAAVVIGFAVARVTAGQASTKVVNWRRHRTDLSVADRSIRCLGLSCPEI